MKSQRHEIPVRTHQPPGTESPELLNLMTDLSNASEQGKQFLLGVAEDLIGEFIDAAGVRILSGSDGDWRFSNEPVTAEPADLTAMGFSAVPEQSVEVSASASHALVPVNPHLALLIEQAPRRPLDHTACRLAAKALDMALRQFSDDRLTHVRTEVTTALKNVAHLILTSRNLPEIFYNITKEGKERLVSDICGIMLIEGEALVMQRCVGNHVSETASLRMQAGQGVGGRVLATQKPCAIENYTESEVISRDFFDLARAEKVKSALAVPLLSENRVIGVLEVWRRRPSTFTNQNIEELAILADLTSLAIENMRLLKSQETAAKELEKAHSKLRNRYDTILAAAEFQEDLLARVLKGSSLAEIIEKASGHLAATVLFIDDDLGSEVCHPAEGLPSGTMQVIRTEILKHPATESRPVDVACDGLSVIFQRVSAESSHIGWIVVVDPTAFEIERVRLAISGISISVALLLLKERAAAEALSDRISSLLWDLLESPDSLRKLAINRLSELQIDLAGQIRVLLCRTEAANGSTKAERLTHEEIEIRRNAIVHAPERVPNAKRYIRLAAFRDDELYVVAIADSAAEIAELADSLIAEIKRASPLTCVSVGVSKPVHDPMDLPAALGSARVARRVASATKSSRAISSESLSVAGLLVNMQDKADFREFVNRALGDLVEKNTKNDVLIGTLRQYFQSNCSQSATASELNVHQKTIAYRLEQIEAKTGLSTSDIEERTLLYLSIKLHELFF